MASREFVDFLNGRKPSDELLYKLKNVLLSVGAVLEDAEDKQVTNSSVKTWLDKLKHAVYDAEDVLDEIATKDLQSKKNLTIERCRDLESLTVAEQHQHDLVALSSLTIRECPNFVSFLRGGLHATNLGSLRIENCESLRSLPEKMHTLLPSLTRFYIQRCKNIETFPEGGLPSSLNELIIWNCEKLVESRMGWSLQDLASLRLLTIVGGSKLHAVSFPEKGLLPTNLIFLMISEFPNLTSFDKNGFENLTSLKDLVIVNCPKLEHCMLEEGLQHLTSLSDLYIYNCPLLTKRRWKRRKGKEWRRKLAHIPYKIVDGEWIE